MCCPQVCVSECPTANEFGERNNPVCVDGVETSRFVMILPVHLISSHRLRILL